MQKLNSLDNLFLLEVQDLYNAEKQITRALPKVAKKVSSPKLKSAIEEHLQQTETHVNRLEEVFKILGQPTKGHACAAMKGILAEADELLGQKAEPAVLDAAIIGAAQKVEHYEIASYGSVIQWAKQMGRDDIKQLLGQTLDEEEKTDQKLSELAKSDINARAI
ncbi:MAG TPA: ferritin-like domain-containing protein [Verrucomicrobiae bacterium]|jgi:ferritin-like metal-binding protein YciE|nr:ferritin-like domain-containing protein [Verrucomicrobiae bacterium]